MVAVTTYNRWIPIVVEIEDRGVGDLWYSIRVNGEIFLEEKVGCYYVTLLYFCFLF